MRCCVFARLLAVVFLLPLAPVSARVLYVNQNASGTVHDGSSWATPCLSVTSALSAAQPGDEVWVSAGTYKENITLKGGVGLYGGFAGTETSREARNPTGNVTTLKGSGGSVMTVPATAGPDTVIDGFTITGGGGTVVGHDSDGYRQIGGGGICCFGSAVISNNVITGNTVYADSQPCGGFGQYSCRAGEGWGGGIYCAGGTPTIRNNVIRDNAAETDGGGIFCGPGAPLVEDNTISSNEVYVYRPWVGSWDGNGGGIACEGSNGIFLRNTIQDNPSQRAALYGGGIYAVGGNPVFSRNTITGNWSDSGGGIYMTAGVCSFNTFSRNGASWGGGAWATGASILRSNIFDDNGAGTSTATSLCGGGVYAENGPIVASNLFTNNHSSSSAGGGCAAKNATVVNNTFVKNIAVNGGALVLSGTGVTANNLITGNTSGVYTTGITLAGFAASFRNNDVFGNTYDDGTGKARYEYGGDAPAQTGAHGNIAADPLFVKAADGDYRLAAGSPCIDAGDDSAYAQPGDGDGRPRLLGAHVDIGAYEAGVPSQRVVYVDRSAAGAIHNGASWNTAFLTVQAGIDAAQSGDQVWVAAAPSAAYAEHIFLKDGVTLYGGFAGFEIDAAERKPAAYATVLDGNGDGMFGVPAAVQAATIDGFTVRNGAPGIFVSGRATVSRCLIRGNRSTNGGGIRVNGAAGLVNNVITDNTASGSGGGVSVTGVASLVNNTIAANTAPFGGGITVTQAGVATVVNTAVAFNSSGIRTDGGTVTVRSSDVFGNGADNFDGMADPTGANGNLSRDPLFVNRTAGDFRLQAGSPCLDAGDDSAVTPGETDPDGKPRIIGAHVDMGAYEFGTTIPPVLYVNRNATGGVHDGTSWDKAFFTVQAAIDAAIPSQEIWVARSAQAMTGYIERITLKDGISLYGGFAGTETRRDQRDPKTNVTILDGNCKERVVEVPATAIHAVTIDGFTIRNGYVYADRQGTGAGIYVAGNAVITNNIITGNISGNGYYEIGCGGGISVSGHATIVHNLITGNQAGLGGGIYLPSGSATVSENTISDNAPSGYGLGLGGGIYVGDSKAVISRNTITGNAGSIGGGGGIYNAGSGTIIDSNLIRGNRGTSGGGIYVDGGQATISNNVVAGNLSGEQGAGVYIRGGSATLINNTIVGNTSTNSYMPDAGTGVVVDKGSGTVVNGIIAFNDGGVRLESATTGTLTLLNTDTYGNTAYNFSGIDDPTNYYRNISADPLFIDRAAGDYHLQAFSPCIDAGDDSAVTLGETDRDGNPRKLGAHVDMGAYEYLTPGYFTLSDAVKALRIAGGLDPSVPGDITRLNVEPGALDTADAVRLIRKAVGLDANP